MILFLLRIPDTATVLKLNTYYLKLLLVIAFGAEEQSAKSFFGGVGGKVASTALFPRARRF